jgi:ribosome biogenesis GTPase / thiamine phosphate phosphatase
MPNSISLESLGATESVWDNFKAHAGHDLALARVSLSIRNEYRVITAAGELDAEPAGSLLYLASSSAELPVAGDWVAIRVIDRNQAIIHAVLPRKGKFSRRAAGGRPDEQILAANIDVAFLVSALDHDFNLRRIERYITLTRESGAEAVVILNKADLCEDVPAYIARIRSIAAGTPVLAVSALSLDTIAPIRAYLGPGQTVALLGSSGVGKSTIVNALLGGERQRTQQVRNGDSRGRHTTSHRELIPLPDGGALIDTPGMRELQLWASQDSLDGAFADIAELAARCRFHDCVHSSEPGCAVAEALATGALDLERWAGYRKLRAEIRHNEVKTDPRAAQEQKQRWKSIHKAYRAYKKHW